MKTRTIKLLDLLVSTGPWMYTDLGPVSQVVPVGTLVEEWESFDGNTGRSDTRYSVATERRERPGQSYDNRASWTRRWWTVTETPSVHRFTDVINDDDDDDDSRHERLGQWLHDVITLTQLD